MAPTARPPGDVVTEVCVVGAGAAGLWAAATAARGGAAVVLLEKTRRPGTKVLASGGTRCNLTTTLDARAAARLFGPGERFLGPAFAALPPHRVRERFAALGVPTVEEPALEKVFPASQRARDVRDALVGEARRLGVEVLLERPVAGIEPGPSGGWTVRLADGPQVLCRAVLACPGGQSHPRSGTTGDGYRWMRELGLAVVEPVPALVPLRSPAPWVRELTGISLQRVEARLLDAAGRVLGRRARPVVFTHHGLSGPGAMDLSEPVARAEAASRREGTPVQPLDLALDLLPDLHADALQALLIEAAERRGAPTLASVLPGEIPRRLLAAAASQAGLPESNPRAQRLDRAARGRLVEALKGLRVPVDGTLGWGEAEVTAGGLALEEVDRRTMGVRRHPGLYALGELLDLSGPIGGLNFQAAFATAELAGLAAARRG
ncbi:aminoacetone oxidase family FAD-binding enzyme [Myxococcota bacterium]|nr:aminoacetone oxidase family FAD-binding enzyme [Myxococcota bacterium]